MSQAITIRVLIADDHAIFRQGLATIINRDPDMNVIAQAENGEQAIVLTTYDSDEDIYRGLQAGAKGYLLKETEPDELVNAIRTVHRGQQYIPPDVGAKLAQRLSNPELSERELEVLRSLAQGMSNADIAAALNIGEGTVKSHVNRILNKLDVSDRTQAVIVAVKRGIVNL
jgi:two-component system, NarL family, response regulator